MMFVRQDAPVGTDKPKPPFLVVGVGNPLLGDDGVGINTVCIIKQRLPSGLNVECVEHFAGGLDLVEQLLDYENVILIDSVVDPKLPEAKIVELSINDFDYCQHASSPHTMGFYNAWRLLEQIDPERLPRKLKMYAINIRPIRYLREGLSPSVQEASELLADMIIKYLVNGIHSSAVPGTIRTK
ncbi:MAG: hydrogenase maturation protease, partial [Candidatus Ranarchaeia archaeon]